LEIEAYYRPQIQTVLEQTFKGMGDAIRQAMEMSMDKAMSPQDAVNAHNAVLQNVTADPKKLADLLKQIWGDAGLKGAKEALAQTGQTTGVSSSLSGMLGGINWDTWKPGGNQRAQEAVMGSGMKNLMANNGVVARGISDTTLERMGDLIAKGIQEGSSYKQISKSLQEVISNPVRADIIAITETTRAFNTSSIDFYQEAQLPGWEWVAYAGACPKCQAQAGPKQFKDPHPPGHPSCRCSVIPLMDSYLTNPGDRTTPTPSTTVRKPRTSRPANNATPTDLPSVAQQTPGMVTEDVPWVPSMTEEQAVDWGGDTMYTYLDEKQYKAISRVGFDTDVKYQVVPGGNFSFGNGAILSSTPAEASQGLGLRDLGVDVKKATKFTRRVQVKIGKVADIDQSREIYEAVNAKLGIRSRYSWTASKKKNQLWYEYQYADAVTKEARARGFDAIRPSANPIKQTLEIKPVTDDTILVLDQKNIVIVNKEAKVLEKTSVAKQIDHLYEPYLEQFEFKPGSFTTMDPKEIQETINPHYASGDKFKVNCARVVQNFELRRRGYVVEANTGHELEATMIRLDQVSETYIEKTWLDPVTGKAPKIHQAGTYGLGGEFQLCSRSILDELGNQEGARGFLEMSHQAGPGGHVINWEIKNGEVVFIDAQTGNVWPEGYSSWAKMRRFTWVRVDNCKPTQTVLRFITKPGEVKAQVSRKKPSPRAGNSIFT